VSGQVLVAQKLGIARDVNTGTKASVKYVGIARAISKRALSMSLILGIGLGALSQAVTPFAIPAVCKSAEVCVCNCNDCNCDQCNCLQYLTVLLVHAIAAL
jgi:hypothetical protein